MQTKPLKIAFESDSWESLNFLSSKMEISNELNWLLKLNSYDMRIQFYKDVGPNVKIFDSQLMQKITLTL